MFLTTLEIMKAHKSFVKLNLLITFIIKNLFELTECLGGISLKEKHLNSVNVFGKI